MLIKNKYYELNKKKFLTDGNFIPECKKILYICSEDDKMQFKYVEENGDVVVFWENKKNTKFVCEVEEKSNSKQQECHNRIIKKSI
jgi:uncharacterized pyridoxamine 5'-phosphate oxidase family protein